jgi:NAD(P)-dependent dehydrogenase (short-subunit alcohol dehydrogenase family)
MMAKGLARLGARVAVLDVNEEAAKAVVTEIQAEGGDALALGCDVLDRGSLLGARERILERYGRVDALINGAGGNRAEATTSAEMPFFALSQEALKKVFDLNLMGTVLACQTFGENMAQQGVGNIVNVASICAIRPVTRVAAYAAAKAAVTNFTQWLAVHMAQEYSPRIRVNAIAPGFFLTHQNRYLLLDAETGQPTPRGQTIVSHTPAGRYGDPEELVGAVVWLLSPASSFVDGATIVIDGGFSAFSGV